MKDPETPAPIAEKFVELKFKPLVGHRIGDQENALLELKLDKPPFDELDPAEQMLMEGLLYNLKNRPELKYFEVKMDSDNAKTIQVTSEGKKSFGTQLADTIGRVVHEEVIRINTKV